MLAPSIFSFSNNVFSSYGSLSKTNFNFKSHFYFDNCMYSQYGLDKRFSLVQELKYRWVLLTNEGELFSLLCSTAPGKPLVPISPATKQNTASILYRGTASRSTFHGGPIRDRRQTNYNGPGGVPMHSQDTSAMGTTGRFSIFNKLTSKFSRRYGRNLTHLNDFWLTL